MQKYNIVRFFENGGRRIMQRGLSLEEAQSHCKSPETSSTTCTTQAGKRRTKEKGRWFDGYEKE